ncbi:lipoyl synthase [Candidatus Pantoea edessiphila]|uniref:Lipoyl synthase n=1 Tax=Candidatus Pantoea edessiphila TaxID=2044610 RepID=A0A2P5SZ09_9GAMM|nr:lipoyl synthase [Candidatus Pantoea edessiphila]MBK4775284.1 lipoyl synthase [Pantoea sp. Edef]PPI87578.1 lipoyl synthase [Candidatus Pantoea edessiphila]
MKIIAIKNIKTHDQEILPKPEWIKIKLPINSSRIDRIKSILRKNNVNSVCEEASCPNIVECFNNNTATFIILGVVCTRKCPFCDVKHGNPLTPPDPYEAEKLANTIYNIGLNYVVITSVNRDDLIDGGAQHFINCIKSIRKKNIGIKVEILVPDFRRCINNALNIIIQEPPDVFGHNIENVPRIYRMIRPGANYKKSLQLLEKFKKYHSHIPTKSGLMLGLGETNDEIIKVMQDLRNHGVTMITLGQYLQPSRNHFPVKRYVPKEEFAQLKKEAISMGFIYAACGPLIRSSYRAEIQDKGLPIV